MIRVLQKGNTHNGASGQLYAVSCVRARVCASDRKRAWCGYAGALSVLRAHAGRGHGNG